MANISIRSEQPGDELHIHEITKAAFQGRPYAGGDEQDVIDRLRSIGAMTLSLVAVEDDVILGQVTFSLAEQADGSEPWFALGPVSVTPERHGQGIGALLINQGLEELKKQGALGCILTGDPNYYQRFGFKVSPEYCPPNEPGEYFQLLVFGDQHPTDRFTFHRAFYEAV